MKERSFDFDKAARLIDHFLASEVKTLIGVEAVLFFRSNFDLEGFQDIGVKKWQALSPGRQRTKKKGSPILTDKGDLKRSIRWEPTEQGVMIFTDEPYAEIHNEGGKITGIFKVAEHKRRTKSGKVTTVRAHDRNVNTTMPQRQFIGESHKLIEHLEDMITKKIIHIMDQCQ